MSIIVELKLTPSVFGRLRKLAALRGETVTELIETKAYGMARTPEASTDFLLLYNDGMDDGQIGNELGLDRAQVKRHRLSMMLPANRKARSI